ncbi:MAG: radical SAM protein [Deltaproteobacteria bacterium]|nr:radical SAM protein [Deltaproteobacteria bacterium]
MKQFYKNASFFEHVYQYHGLIPGVLRPLIASNLVKLQSPDPNTHRLPYKLIYFVTNRCNMTCPHCFYGRELNTDTDELRVSEVKTLAASLNREVAHLIITGGEPFMRQDLAEILKIFHFAGGVQNITINTNGTGPGRIAECIAKLIRETDLVFNFQVSLDGLEQQHNEIRGLPKAFEWATGCIEELKALRKQSPGRIQWIQIVTCFSKSNFRSVEEIVRLVQGIDGVKHAFTMTRSSTDNTYGVDDEGMLSGLDPLGDVMMTPDEVKWTYEKLEELVWKKFPYDLFYRVNREVHRSAMQITERKQRIFPCMAGYVDLVVYPNGDVARCEMLKPIGNLRETNCDLRAFLETRKARDFFAATTRCACTHDCNILSSIKQDEKAMTSLLSPLR